MKKRIIHIVIEVLVVLGVVALSLSMCQDYFLGRGVNVLGGCAHINIQKTCYFFGPDHAEVIGQSTLTISGLVLPEEGDKSQPFTGYVNVEQYPLSAEDNYKGTLAHITDEFIIISSQSLPLLDPEAVNYYNVWILKSNPEVIIVQIFHNDEYTTAVCAESEEEAIDNLQQYYSAITNHE